jgi:hypothetical protein
MKDKVNDIMKSHEIFSYFLSSECSKILHIFFRHGAFTRALLLRMMRLLIKERCSFAFGRSLSE